MSWTAWFLVAAVGVGVIAIQFILEIFHIFGKLLDQLPPKLGMVILGAVFVACALAGLAMMPRR